MHNSLVILIRFSLPHRQTSANYDIAWAGFDVFLFVGLAGTSVTVLRRSPWMAVWGGAVAALLFTDAWFDVVTSDDTRRVVMALLSAVVVELPLALICFWLALSTEKVRRRAYRLLWRRASSR